MIDTTSLTNGMHTISWVVTDDQGSTEGIGSRFFTVSNGSGALTAAQLTESAGARTAARGTSVPRQRPPTDTSVLARDRTSLAGRRGWDLSAPLRTFEPDDRGRVVVRSEEVNRIELHLGPDYTVGYLQTNDGPQALPIGSQLDGSGVFTWAPGVGFVGAYDFVFVRADGDEAASRRDVRILLAAKGSGLRRSQVVIDTPRSQQDVGQPFVLGGWAADLDAAQGTGIATLHAWAYRWRADRRCSSARRATAALGRMWRRSTVTSSRRLDSGCVVQGLTAGNYDLAVFAWSIERADFAPATNRARDRSLTVRPSAPQEMTPAESFRGKTPR